MPNGNPLATELRSLGDALLHLREACAKPDVCRVQNARLDLGSLPGVSDADLRRARLMCDDAVQRQADGWNKAIASASESVDAAIGRVYAAGFDVPPHWHPPAVGWAPPVVRLERNHNEALVAVRTSSPVEWIDTALQELRAAQRKAEHAPTPTTPTPKRPAARRGPRQKFPPEEDTKIVDGWKSSGMTQDGYDRAMNHAPGTTFAAAQRVRGRRRRGKQA